MEFTVKVSDEWEQGVGYRAEVELSSVSATGVYAAGATQESAAARAIDLARKVDKALMPAPAPKSDPLPLSAEVAVDEDSIRTLLQKAIEADDSTIELDYKDAAGERTSREVHPLTLRAGRRFHGDNIPYLIARQVSDDELRTFRLDRIERVTLP